MAELLSWEKKTRGMPRLNKFRGPNCYPIDNWLRNPTGSAKMNARATIRKEFRIISVKVKLSLHLRSFHGGSTLHLVSSFLEFKASKGLTGRSRTQGWEISRFCSQNNISPLSATAPSEETPCFWKNAAVWWNITTHARIRRIKVRNKHFPWWGIPSYNNATPPCWPEVCYSHVCLLSGCSQGCSNNVTSTCPITILAYPMTK